MRFSLVIKRSIAILNACSIVATQAIFANQIVIDTTQAINNPHLTHSDNNIDIVNIAKPTQAGISNNFYHDFNVSQNGAILNNALSQDALVQTQLAGYIYSNPNLDSATAKLILNQVTGGNISQLLGYLEIAGSKADMILANPNGITCQGCGFINAANVTLATGLLSKEELERLNALQQYNTSIPITLNIKRGDIVVDTLDARNVTSLTLLAKSMNVADSLQAQNLRVLLGSNQVSFSPLTLLYQPIITNNKDTQNALALDVAYLGSIVSNKIFIVATDEGVGIKNAGIIASTASTDSNNSGFVLQANGKIEIAKPIDTTTLANIHSTPNHDNASNNNMITNNPTSQDSIDTASNITFAPTLYAEGSMDIQAQSLENYSIIHAQGDIAIKADSILNKGHADIDKKVISTEKFNSWHPTLNGKFGDGYGTGTYNTTYRYDIVTYQEEINQDTYSPSIIIGDNITIQAKDFTNDTGIIHAKGEFNNYAQNFVNTSPQLRQIVAYENGTKETYDRHGKCNWLLDWISKDFFCGSTWTTTGFTRASEYTLLDYKAPDISLNNLEANSLQTILTIGSNSTQPNVYTNDLQGVISGFGFQKHIIDNNIIFKADTNNLAHATSLDSLRQVSQIHNAPFMSEYQQRLQNLTNAKDTSLQIGISGSTINIQAQNAINESNLSAGRDLLIDSDFIINNNGQIIATEGLNLKADSIKQNGGTLKADNVKIKANDVSIASSALSNKAQKTYTTLGFQGNRFGFFEAVASTSSNTTLGSLARIEGNNINITADNASLKGADLQAKGNINIISDTLTIDTLATNNAYSDKTATYNTTHNIASSLNANNITLQTNNDMTLVSASLQADNSLTLDSGENITMDTVKDSTHSITNTKDTKSETFSTTTTHTAETKTNATNLASNLAGDTININANKNIETYNLNATSNDIHINAGDTLTLSNRADIEQTHTNTRVENVGFTASADNGKFSISVGKDTISTNTMSQDNTHNNTALQGQNIALQAANDVKLESTDINTNDTMNIAGKNVSIQALDNTSNTTTTTHFTSNRFGISINQDAVIKPLVNVAVINPAKNDLNNMPFAFTKNLSNKIQPLSFDINLEVGFTHKNITTTQNDFSTSASSANLSGKNISIVATNDANIIGSNVTGQSIDLSGKNVNIEAKEEISNTSAKTVANEIKTELKLEIGKNNSISGGVDYNRNTNDTITNIVKHKGSNIVADNLTITANDTTNIIGSNIATQDTTITTKDFNLAQATNTESSKTDSTNLSVNADVTFNGSIGFNANGSYGNTHNNTFKTVAQGSTFSANNLILNSSNDSNIIGSNMHIANTADIQTNNFNVTSATNTNTQNTSNFNINGGFGFGGGFNVSLGMDQGSSNTHATTNTASNLTIGNLALNANGDTNLIGSNLNAQNAEIATNTLNLTASKDSQYTNSQSFGADVGFKNGFDMKANTSIGSSDSTSYNNAQFQTQNLTLTTNDNLNMHGATIQADTMNANVGGNLNITSLQDSKNAMQLDVNISSNIKDTNVGFMHTDYKSVTNQSGINGGLFTLNVGGDTSMQGAYIEGSKGSSFTTDSLSGSSLSNSSFYIDNANSTKVGFIPYSSQGTTISSIGQNIVITTHNSDGIVRNQRQNNEAIDFSQEVAQSIIKDNNAIVNEVVASIQNPKQAVKKHIIMPTLQPAINTISSNVANGLTNVSNEILDTSTVEQTFKDTNNIKNEVSQQIHKEIPILVDDLASKGVDKVLDISMPITTKK